MEVVSLCRLPVASLVWRPRPDAWMFTFACKATYTLLPVESPLAHVQEPIHSMDRHWSDDPSSSVRASSDLAPIRPRADVVVVGHAFAPNGKPVRSLHARLLIGEVDKSVEVHADRLFAQDGALQEGPPFAKMPLLWERAAGGPETNNPVGVRADARDVYGRRKLPNLQPPGVLVKGPGDVIEPIGLGPVAPAWPPRRQRLGRHAATWSDRDWSRQPLPADIDATYFNAAPRDQQIPQIRDDERLLLENLHAEHPRLVTNLSGQRPRVFAARPGQPPQAVPMRADLLWIHTDRGLCTLTWRGQIPLSRPDEEGRVLVALEEPGQTLSWDQVRELEAQQPVEIEAEPDSEAVASTLAPPRDFKVVHTTASAPLERSEMTAVLPFAQVGRPAAAMPFAPALQGGPERPPEWPAFAAPPAVTRPSSVPPTAAMPPTPPPRPNLDSPPPALPAIPSPPPVPAIAVAAAPAVAPPPLVRLAAAPRTIGEAALEAAAPQRPAETSPAAAGAAGASTAAAAASAPWTLPREEAARDAAPAPAAARPAAQPPAEPQEPLELLWFDAESVARVRRQPAWRALLQELQRKPADKEIDDATLGKEPVEIEDRREIFEILACATPADAPALHEALAGAVRAHGKLATPLRLAAGLLIFPFDELEMLKATMATVSPFTGSDEGLRAAVAAAQELLKLPDLRSAPAVAEALTTRIREAWATGKRAVPQSYLETQTERALLEGRCYQRRRVLGGKHLRALMQPAGSQEMIPTYLPEPLADGLPLYQRFRARLVAELHPQRDQYETHPIALRALALARVLPPPARR